MTYLAVSSGITYGNNSWQYTVPISWLRGDHDDDGIINLDDPQALLACSGDIFEPGACPMPAGADIGLEDIPLDTPSDTSAVGFPYATGDRSIGYACDAVIAGGGTAIAAYSGFSYGSLFPVWAREYWQGEIGSVMGTPSEPKPYEGAYNMVRAGGSGMESAYFSACWGKKASYIAEGGGSSNAGTYARVGASYKWHRYVIIGSRWYFQWWNGSCWKSLGIDATTGTSPLPYLRYSNSSFDPRRLVPVGFLPGDVLAETYSNIESGLYQIPGAIDSGMSEYDSRVVSGPWLPSVAGSGGSGSSSQLTVTDLEQAFGNALRQAGVGGGNGLGEGFDAIGTGEGATDAAGSVFGVAGVGDNGVGGAVAGGAGSGRDEFLDGLTATLGLESIDPATDAEAVFEFDLNVPGAGVRTYSMSTLPDVSTAGGAALEVVRIALRLGVAIWWTVVLTLKLVGMYKEIT